MRKVVPFPPWLWLWLVVYVGLSLPSKFEGWKASLALILNPEPISFFGEDVGRLAYVAAVPYLMLDAVFIAGLLTVLAPWARAAYLERRFRLGEFPSTSPPALAEIAEFAHRHAPGAVMKFNAFSPGQTAFVYPLGYRRSAIAIFGGFVKLWRVDREAAEAVLLHEISHLRNGDALIMGSGSLFTAFLRYGFAVAWICLLAACFSLVGILVKADYIDGMNPLLGYSLVAVAMFLTATYFAFMMAPIFLMLPITAIWVAELNADRFAANTQNSHAPLLAALHELSGKTSWWRWVLSRMSHPPTRLRMWLAPRWKGSAASAFILLAFPVAVLAQSAFSVVESTGYEPGRGAFADEFLVKLKTQLDGSYAVWIFLCLAILLWPAASRLWTWLFSRDNDTGWRGSGAFLACGAALFSAFAAYHALPPARAIPYSGPLAPGAHSTNLFEPALSFRVDEGWQAYDSMEENGHIVMHRDDLTVQFLNPHKVFTPGLNEINTVYLDTMPEDLPAWIEAHPDLSVSRRTPVEVGGAKGFQFDVTVPRKPDTSPDECGEPCILLFSNRAGGWAGIPDGHIYRLILLDVGGERAAIMASAPEDSFASSSPSAESLLSTVVWEGVEGSAEAPDILRAPLTELRSEEYILAGPYETTRFESPFSFAAGSGWSAGYPEAEDTFSMTRSGGAWIEFDAPGEVFDPMNGKAVPAPENLAAWLRGHPHLDTDEPSPTTVGGRPAVAFEARVEAPEERLSECESGPCLPLFPIGGGGSYAPEPGAGIQFVAVETEGRSFLASTNAPVSGDSAPEAMEVLESIEWLPESGDSQ